MYEKSSKRNGRSLYQRNFVELIVFNSAEYYAKYDSSKQSMIDRAIETVHLADFYYATIPDINIHLSLVDVYTYETEDSDPTTGLDNVNKILDAFFEDHSDNMDIWPNHDNAVLIVTREFRDHDEYVVGLAELDALCDSSRSGSFIKDYSTIEQLAGTMAHELGHNFGLEHNPTNPNNTCYCGEEACVMDTFASYAAPVAFTQCQMDSIADYVHSGSAMCLHNEPLKLIEVPFCGDYLVNQESEGCDCGSLDTCGDPCCNPTDCTLKEGAVCSAMDLCCDPNTCHLMTNGTTCRPAWDDWDVAEVCNGVSSECPSDEYKQTGTNEENSSMVESTLIPVMLGTIAAVLAVIAVLVGLILVRTRWVKVQK